MARLLRKLDDGNDVMAYDFTEIETVTKGKELSDREIEMIGSTEVMDRDGEVVNAEVLTEDTCMTYDYYHQIKGGRTPKAAATYVEEKAEAKSEAKPGVVKYKCKVCGYVYDPERGDPDGGIKPGTPFEALPDDWVCPVCGAARSEFEEVD